MSLDVYLKQEGVKIKKPQSSGIFVRENGANVEISEQEWNARHPDRDPVRFLSEDTETEDLYHANITHNLGKMAEEVGIYQHLWRPEEIDINTAFSLIAPLTAGFFELRNRPEHFKQFNSENGWGTYEQLLAFVQNYLIACIKYPDATIYASR